MDLMIKEAKEKLAKGDKKGASGSCSFVRLVLGSEWGVSYTCMLFTFFSRSIICNETKETTREGIG
jgi:hypothetical protein